MHLQAIKKIMFRVQSQEQYWRSEDRYLTNERFNAVNMAHMNRKTEYGQKPRTDRQKND